MDGGFAFMVLILVAALVLFAVVSGTLHPARGGRRSGAKSGGGSPGSAVQLSRSEFATRWATIEVMSGPAGGGSGLRNAVAEADKLFDQALRQSGFSGSTMGDRLKSARSRFSDNRAGYDAIWRAHKLRNALAHEVTFDLVPSQAREALHDFERGLRHLGVL